MADRFEPLGRDSEEKRAEPVQGGPFMGRRVTSVTVRPMKFITLDDGQRIFEGGLLPGGQILEKVTPRELTLRKGNITTPYQLRGAHE